MEVTVENIKLFLSNKEFKNIEIEKSNNKLTVNIYNKPSIIWDEKRLVTGTCQRAVAVMSTLFSNSKIDKVNFFTIVQMRDYKGNLKDENVIYISLTKQNAKDINWPEFGLMVLHNYNALLRVADDYYIDPGILNKLDY